MCCTRSAFCTHAFPPPLLDHTLYISPTQHVGFLSVLSEMLAPYKESLSPPRHTHTHTELHISILHIITYRASRCTVSRFTFTLPAHVLEIKRFLVKKNVCTCVCESVWVCDSSYSILPSLFSFVNSLLKSCPALLSVLLLHSEIKEWKIILSGCK